MYSSAHKPLVSVFTPFQTKHTPREDKLGFTHLHQRKPCQQQGPASRLRRARHHAPVWPERLREARPSRDEGRVAAGGETTGHLPHSFPRMCHGVEAADHGLRGNACQALENPGHEAPSAVILRARRRKVALAARRQKGATWGEPSPMSPTTAGEDGGNDMHARGM